VKTISGKEQLRKILDDLNIARYRYISPEVKFNHNPLQQEIRRRTQVAVWAYACEIKDDPMVSDAIYDQTARLINPQIHTGDEKYDRFFEQEFSPNTGMWIHQFPTTEYLEIYYSAWKRLSNQSSINKDG